MKTKHKIIQQWQEHPQSKTGWMSLGWQYADNFQYVEPQHDDIEITESDKFGNPIEGYVTIEE